MFRRLTLLVCICSVAFSQDGYRDIPDVVTKVATSAANWLKLETGTRAIAMSGAHTASGRGVSSLAYNPAAITFMPDNKNQEVYFSKSNYLVDMSHNVLGYGRKLTRADYLGLHLFYLDSGEMDITTAEYPDGGQGTFSVQQLCFRISYGRIITKRLRIGATFKIIREDIHTSYMQSYAFDIGSNFDTGILTDSNGENAIILGMSVSNFGPEVRFEGPGLDQVVDTDVSVDGQLRKITEDFSLPLMFRLGVYKNMLSMGRHNLLVSVDMINSMDYTTYMAAGMEYSLGDFAYLRAGTHLLHDTARFSCGAGLKYGGFVFDYALSNFSVLENTHQFAIGYEF